MEKGLTVTACEACAEARGYNKGNTMEGFKRHSMDWYLASAFDADRVLHIGGE
jgi:tRNA 2-thiouridine synthesizing protein D